MTNHTCAKAERWRPIPGWDGCYEVSDCGNVRSLTRLVDTKQGRRTIPGRVMRLTSDAQGRKVVNLSRNNQPRQYKVHRLVMLAFVGPCPNGMEVCHNNGDPADNRLENLRYDTHRENVMDTLTHGTNYWANLETCNRGHRLEEPNLLIHKRKDGSFKKRTCRACHRTRTQVKKDPSRKSSFDAIADANYQSIMGV